MRRFYISFSVLLLALAVPRPVFPQDADTAGDSADSSGLSADTSELFLNAYMANEDGEKLEGGGDSSKALEKYRYAASLLDQISHDDPKWQPIVVDYRKKKVSENIARLQKQMGLQAPPDAGTVPIEGEMPAKGLPDLSGAPTPTPVPAGGTDQAVIEELRNDLRESQDKLKSVESEKQALADRLESALKVIDAQKVSVTELQGQLKQAQDAYQNALNDHTTQAGGTPNQYQKRIAELEDALKNAEAEVDAANEENSDYARRATKAHQGTLAIVQERDAALASVQDLKVKFASASKLADKLDAANKEITTLTKARDDAKAQATQLDQELANTSQAAAQLVTTQKELAELKATDEEKAEKSKEIASKLEDAKSQIEQLTSDKEAAGQQIAELSGKLADAKNQIASVKAERDQIAAQRDEALAELGKAKEAEKRVNELLADNTTLTKKLADDDLIIKNFKSDSPDKDKQIAELRKEVTDTKALLASAQQQKDSVQATLNDLQQQYDSTTAELTELKAKTGISSSEKKTLTDENSLLRDIVVRQLKAQAVRDQTKRLVMDELSQLNIQSETLLKRINFLGEPVVQLSDKEKALFKDEPIDIPDTGDDTGMDIHVAAPKQSATPSMDANPIAETTPPPMPSDSPPATALDPGAEPSATPIDMAKANEPSLPESLLPSPTPAPGAEQGSPSSGGPSATGTTGRPAVPEALLPDAHDAKEAFDKQDYRTAERIYEKMLTQAPNNVYILSNLGVVYFRNEKWQLAEESLKKAIAVAPQDVFSWCTLGIVYYQEKRYDDAVNALVQALAIDPHYAVAHNYLGITASQKGWQDAAKKELQTAVEYDPNYADAYFNLAVVYAMDQPPNKEMARKYYEKAKALGAEPDPGLDELLK